MMIRGKSPKAVSLDIVEGYTTVNPLFLKPLDDEVLKELYKELAVAARDVRGSKFPTHDQDGIRMRNLKLQRLHTAAMIIRNYAKLRKIILV